MSHFCLKQQCDNYRGFFYVMKHTKAFTTLYMDGKGSTADPYFGGFVNTLYECFDPYSITSLQILIVRSCKLFSNSVLLQMVKHCKNIRTLGKYRQKQQNRSINNNFHFNLKLQNFPICLT